jgi:formiminotetrahydrofolate cyclodeaminase
MSSDSILGLRVVDLLDRVGDSEPLPGAGAVAALATAMAAGLLEMAARGPMSDWRGAETAVADARALRERAGMLADTNIRAYAEARDALAEARERGPLADSPSLGESLAAAADVPLAITEAASEVVALGERMHDHVADDIRADVRVAVILATGASRSAATLVDANLVRGGESDVASQARVLSTTAERCMARVLAS